MRYFCVDFVPRASTVDTAAETTKKCVPAGRSRPGHTGGACGDAGESG